MGSGLRIAGAAAALGASIAAAHAWANSPASLARLRARAESALRARVAEARVGEAFAVDWLGRMRFGPVEIAASERDAPPVVRVEEVTVRPRWWALLRGRPEPARVTLRGVRVEAGIDGEELAALAARLSRSRPPQAPGPAMDAPEVRIEDAAIAAGALALGPLDARVVRERRGPSESLRVQVWLAGGGRGDVEAVWGGGPGRIRASLDEVAAASLPRALRERLPFAVPGGLLSARAEGRDLATLAAGAARIEVVVDGLLLEGERLAPEAVGPARLSLDGLVRWDLPRRRAALERGEVAIGEVAPLRVAVRGEVAAGRDPSFALEARVDRVDWAAALSALPPALVPEGGPRVDGPLSASLSASGPLGRPADWRIAADLDLSGLRRAARAAQPVFLRGTFAWRPPDSGDAAPLLVIGPESPDFVPVAELPAHVVRAVTTSEDAGFFAHRGFDFAEMRNAIAERAGTGRLRGASTITQQVAKNLFLSQERTLARKAREALLTIALEASLPKARLLEIYLNIAEWGPGLHGIGPAARHYFGKDARTLTPKEAAFLATIIPNPVRYHVYYARGALSEAWEARVAGLLEKMREAGSLSDEQFLEALDEPLVFARG